MDISNSNIVSLSRKLENNTIAIATIESQIENIKTLPFYQRFGLTEQRREDIRAKNRLKDRVLKMRINLLQKLSDAVYKEIFFTQEEITKPLNKLNNYVNR